MRRNPILIHWRGAKKIPRTLLLETRENWIHRGGVGKTGPSGHGDFRGGHRKQKQGYGAEYHRPLQYLLLQLFPDQHIKLSAVQFIVKLIRKTVAEGGL